MKINGSWNSVLREERLKMNDYSATDVTELSSTTGVPKNSIVVNHSIAESVELLSALLQESNGEGPMIPPGSTVTWTYRVTNNGAVEVGEEFSIAVPAGGIAKVTFNVMVESGDLVLYAKYQGVEFIKIGVLDTGIERASYRIDVRRSRNGVNPFTGEPIVIPTSFGSSHTLSTFMTGTGQTTSQTARFHTSCSQPLK